MRIGLLGGSFDPIHRAHIALAQAALAHAKLDQIQLIPAGQPWQRDALKASPKDRAAMVQCAISGQAQMVLNDQEINREGPTYTIDTLAALPKEHEYVWILGSDQLRNFCSWFQWEEIAQQVGLLVAERPGTLTEPPEPLAKQINAGKASLERLPFEPIDISATLIREQLAQGHLPIDALDSAVLDYIQQHNLYQTTARN
jgi:nicotinate-nucleotide adenylyltransferase